MTRFPQHPSRLGFVLLTTTLALASPAAAAGTGNVAGGAPAPGSTPASALTSTGTTSSSTGLPATATTPTQTSTTGASSALGLSAPSTAARTAPLTRTAHTAGGKVSTGAILAAVIAGLLALACLVWGGFRWTAIEPRWTLPLRHSMAEAGFRASAVWAEFSDWIRLGH